MGKKRAQAPGATPATAELTALSIPFSVHSYVHDPSATSYGLEAAQALSVEPGRVLKTLLAQVDTELVVGVVPVTEQLDLKALAAALGGKRAAMAEAAAAERATGYVVGGISPIGQRRRLRTAIDLSVEGWTTVFVSGGRRGFEIELAPSDLVAATGAVVAPLAR